MRIARLLAPIAFVAAAAFANFSAPALAQPAVPQEAPPSPQPPASNVLTLKLASGRTFAGQVDAATNSERLVLRTTKDGFTLRRPIAWDRITAAQVDGQDIELAKLRAVAEGLRSELEIVPQPETSQEPGVRSEEPVEAVAAPAMQRVVAVTFDPRLANWDGDVETDGLAVDVMPLDAAGYLAAASGTVEVELVAPQRRVFHHAPLSGGDTLERIERWTRTVQPGDFGPSGVRLQLPFGAVHPEFDLDWMGIGLVHVKFVAPGHGVFEDSRDAVRIRPFAPLRDQLEQKGYPRFLPTERVGRWN